MKILHGFTGSVASTLFPKIQKAYKDHKHEAEYVVTKSAGYFGIDKHSKGVYFDEYEWMGYDTFKKVLHIELVKNNDMFVIAPLSANTLAKIANGICDNLLTCVARAWDFSKPFVVAPAMNTRMMSHPITQEHIAKIKSWGIKVIDPISKELFCCDVGIGAMADISTIMETIKTKKKVQCEYCIDGMQWVGDPCYGAEQLVPCFNCGNK